jgi:ubiquitin C-terminal hydrolase
VVEWCYEAYKKEIKESNIRLIINHESNKLNEEDHLSSTKTLDECLNLFLEKEYLDGKDQEIYCSKCRCPQNFYKKYDIDRLPPILILSFKRFKYAKLYKKKIDNVINFPLYDFDLKNHVTSADTNYDLFGIVVRFNF